MVTGSAFSRASLSIVQATLVVVVAISLATALAGLRTPTPVPPGVERAVDRRPAGERAVEDAQRRLAAAPGDVRAETALAIAYLIRARETGDPGFYSRADVILNVAFESRPGDVDVLVGLGSLALSRHDFVRALEWGRQAVALNPSRAAAYGVLVDALTELGEYDEAVASAQVMVDLRPDQASLSRVSYLRELYGDLPGAIEAMRLAVQAGAPDSEATAWSEVQLGHLLFATGDIEGARRAYEVSTRRVDGYVFGLAGQARVLAARGELAGAVALYEPAATLMPIPELVIALGDAYERLGDLDRAEEQYTLLGAMARLLAANGVRVDLEIAQFHADHGRNLQAARDAARLEYSLRPSVHVADVLAWTDYRLGDLAAAQAHSAAALGLGTRDPLMLYHAGVIAEATGDQERARELLQASADMNAMFSLRWSSDLAARLAQLSTGGGSR